MKVIKWAGAGASLPDPVYAHLITPKYEHELPSGNGKCGAACRCCCVPVARIRQRPKRSVDHASSNDRSGT